MRFPTCPLILALAIAAALPAQTGSYLYRTIEGGRVVTSVVTISETPGGYLLSKTDRERNYSYRAELDKDLSTLSYRSINQEQGIDLRVALRSNALSAQGRLFDATVDKVYAAKRSPFRHYFVLQLQPFIRSQDRTVRFVSLRPDTLEPYEFEARKEALETVVVADTGYQAWRVKVSLTGLLAAAGSSQIWFRASDGIVLKQDYKTLDGVPGSFEFIGAAARPGGTEGGTGGG